jgi:hypothetical protein
MLGCESADGLRIKSAMTAYKMLLKQELLAHVFIGLETDLADKKGIFRHIFNVFQTCEAVSSSASCSAPRATCKAVTTSSKSPSMMVSSLYSVRLMR